MSLDIDIKYSIAFFLIVFIAATVLNLFRQHYVFQVTGIAFLFIIAVIRVTTIVKEDSAVTLAEVYGSILPLISSIGACLAAMSLGFWIFPVIRGRFKN